MVSIPNSGFSITNVDSNFNPTFGFVWKFGELPFHPIGDLWNHHVCCLNRINNPLFWEHIFSAAPCQGRSPEASGLKDLGCTGALGINAYMLPCSGGDERSIYELFWCASCSSKEKIQNGRAGIMDRTGTVHQHWVYWIHSTLFHHSPAICRSARWLRPVRSCELTPQVCCGEERWPRTPPLLPCSTIFHRWVMGLGFMVHVDSTCPMIHGDLCPITPWRTTVSWFLGQGDAPRWINTCRKTSPSICLHVRTGAGLRTGAKGRCGILSNPWERKRYRWWEKTINPDSTLIRINK